MHLSPFHENGHDGQVTILDSAFNCYRINMINSAGPYTYTGLAALGDTAVQNDTLYLAVTEANVRSVVGVLLRQ